MSILTNKHVVVALIVTPILAVLGYFAVDAMVSEVPHAAVAGGRYELVEKPNCRYNSGVCGLKNGDFELKLSTEWREAGGAQLVLRSIFPLQGARVALVAEGAAEKPVQDMQRVDQQGLNWALELPSLDPDMDRLRVVVAANNTVYYGDVGMKFSLYKTTFEEDFRR